LSLLGSRLVNLSTLAVSSWPPLLSLLGSYYTKQKACFWYMRSVFGGIPTGKPRTAPTTTHENLQEASSSLHA